MTSESNKYSQFWMADVPVTSDSLSEVSTLLNLAKYRRAISNFVKIVTTRDIPVKFSSKDEAFTDGKFIVISSAVTNNDYDPIVGLALHEASHCLLTTFSLMKTIEENIPLQYIHKANNLGIPKKVSVKIVRDLFNWIEDRRIDYYMFTNSPGYQGYYLSMYNRYFYSDVISQGLKSEQFRNEDVESYMYRIINILNDSTELNALKGLQKIYNIIDIKKINRLDTTKQALQVALDMYDVMLDNLNKTSVAEEMQDKKGDESKSGDDSSGGNSYFDDEDETESNDGQSNSDEAGDEPSNSDKTDDDKSSDTESNSDKTDTDSNDEPITLTDKELEKALEAFKKQRQFLNGKIKKVKLTDEQAKKVELLLDSKSEIKTVSVSNDSIKTVHKVKVVVMNMVSLPMFKSQLFPFSRYDSPVYEKEVNEGIVLGIQLGKKLKIRNEEKEIKFTRKETGNIDRRLIAEFGCGTTNLFTQTFVDKYAKAIIHISIDVSGSMYGSKLGKALTTVTAICKAASMIQNLDVVVSLRGTIDSNFISPMIAVVYDSRVDKFIKVKQWFPRITANGLTPEGLCFAAIEKEIKCSSAELKSYFLNFSDGEPCYGERGTIQYSGELAALHTLSEVKKMIQKGVKVVSYFISDDSINNNDSLFKRMYGRDAKTINTANMIQVAKTMNEMFLSNEAKV